jgi:hypothetical protein
MALPECYYCRFDELGFPCRGEDGAIDFETVAHTYVAAGRLFTPDGVSDEAAYNELRRATDCVFEIEQKHPELALTFVTVAIDACETLEGAAFVAAGPVENMAVKHGSDRIDMIEAVAANSAKFRYMLSGIWRQSGGVEQAVWDWIGRAVAGSGRMSSDARGPWDGQPVNVLEDEAALALLQESVAVAAAAIGIK